MQAATRNRRSGREPTDTALDDGSRNASCPCLGWAAEVARPERSNSSGRGCQSTVGL